jgi:hypothetical protein
MIGITFSAGKRWFGSARATKWYLVTEGSVVKDVAGLDGPVIESGDGERPGLVERLEA